MKYMAASPSENRTAKLVTFKGLNSFSPFLSNNKSRKHVLLITMKAILGQATYFAGEILLGVAKIINPNLFFDAFIPNLCFKLEKFTHKRGKCTVSSQIIEIFFKINDCGHHMCHVNAASISIIHLELRLRVTTERLEL